MKKPYLISSLTLTLATFSYAAEFYDFNLEGLNSNPTTGLTVNGNNFVRSGIGLDGTNGLEGTRFYGSASAVSTAQLSLDTSSDFVITQSVYFNTNTLADATTRTGISGDDAIFLGLTDQSSQLQPSNYTNYSLDFVNAGFRMTDPSTLSFQFFGTNDRFIASPDFSAFKGAGVSGSLAVDTWYLLTAEFAYDSANDEWDISRRIQESDSSGNIVSAGFDIGDVFTLANTMGVNPDVYGFIGGESFGGENGGSFNGNGIVALDNLTLLSIPEPSSYALISGALALGWIMVRRR